MPGPEWFVVIDGVKYTWPQVIYKISTGAWTLEQAMRFTGFSRRGLLMRLRLEAHLLSRGTSIGNAALQAVKNLAAKQVVKTAGKAVVQEGAKRAGLSLLARAGVRVGAGLLVGIGVGLAVVLVGLTAYEIYRAVSSSSDQSSSKKPPKEEQLLVFKGDIGKNTCTDGSDSKLKIFIDDEGTISGRCDIKLKKSLGGGQAAKYLGGEGEIAFTNVFIIYGTYDSRTRSVKGTVKDGHVNGYMKLPPLELPEGGKQELVKEDFDLTYSGTFKGVFENDKVVGTSIINYINKSSSKGALKLLEGFMPASGNQSSPFTWQLEE